MSLRGQGTILVKPVINPISSLELENGAEITAFSQRHKLSFVINGSNSLDVVRYKNFQNPKLQQSLSLTGSGNSVAISEDGLIAVATAEETNNRGSIEFLQIKDDGSIKRKGSVGVGNLPDSVAFSPDGRKLVVANEGEPNQFYGTEDGKDPAGSISILRIDARKPEESKVTSLDFSSFSTRELRKQGVRISGLEGTTPATDIEPEYVTIAPDSKSAFVTLQENNAIAAINLKSDKIQSIFSAGIQKYKKVGIFDTSDEDGGFNPGKRDFFGLRMPDGASTFEQIGKTYVITANEGDSRVRPDNVNFVAPDEGTYFYGTKESGTIFESFEDPLTGKLVYVTNSQEGSKGSFEAEVEDEFFITLKYGAAADDGFYSDEIRAGDLSNPSSNKIVSGANEGRLNTIADRNTKENLFAYGGRSFTIYDSVTGQVVYDSGDRLDHIVNKLGLYDDGRSDDKSIEPEGVVTATLGGRTYAFIGLERPTESVIPVFDVSNPKNPKLETVFQSPSSLSPEGLTFIQTGRKSGVLQVANEVSGTLDIFEFGL
jgi:DNA-binding beta-propeller fold protein YncE